MPDAVFVGLSDLGHDLPAIVAIELIERVGDFHAASTAGR
jgi:hypothetical protein